MSCATRLISCPDPYFFEFAPCAGDCKCPGAFFFTIPERPGASRKKASKYPAGILGRERVMAVATHGIRRGAIREPELAGVDLSLPIPASPPSPGDLRSVTDYEGHYGPDDRRRMVLTEQDLEAIKRVACACPHGMTAEDIFKLRSFLKWWEDVKNTVGGYVLKGGLALIIAIGILLAWISKGGGQG